MGKRRESILRGEERYDTILMEILHNEFYERNKIINKIKKQ
jgi:hypothetical protein